MGCSPNLRRHPLEEVLPCGGDSQRPTTDQPLHPTHPPPKRPVYAVLCLLRDAVLCCAVPYRGSTHPECTPGCRSPTASAVERLPSLPWLPYCRAPAPAAGVRCSPSTTELRCRRNGLRSQRTCRQGTWAVVPLGLSYRVTRRDSQPDGAPASKRSMPCKVAMYDAASLYGSLGDACRPLTGMWSKHLAGGRTNWTRRDTVTQSLPPEPPEGDLEDRSERTQLFSFPSHDGTAAGSAPTSPYRRPYLHFDL